MSSNLPTTPGITSELLTSKQAASLLAVGERTLWRWSRSGRAPAPLKIGDGPRSAVRFRRSDLLEWIANGCRPTDGRARQ